MRILPCILMALLCTLLVSPVLGFTSDTLEIDIQENGGARVTFTFSLSWFERLAVFFQIADPVEELEKAMESLTVHPVEVEEVTGSSAAFSTDHFAAVEEEPGFRTYSTPELHFPQAGEILRTYWFAPLVQADFSPEVTRVRFPDGTTEVLYGQEIIPPLHHREPRMLTAQIGG